MLQVVSQREGNAVKIMNEFLVVNYLIVFKNIHAFTPGNQ
jgi:hypothetical protein